MCARDPHDVRRLSDDRSPIEGHGSRSATWLAWVSAPGSRGALRPPRCGQPRKGLRAKGHGLAKGPRHARNSPAHDGPSRFKLTDQGRTVLSALLTKG